MTVPQPTAPPTTRGCVIAILTVLAGAGGGTLAQNTPEQLAESARLAMAEQRFPDAAQAYRELAIAFPSEPALQANLGMALHMSGQDREAIDPLRAAAKAIELSFPAHFFLGASLVRLGEHQEAIEPLRRATSLDPEHPFAKALLGDALEQAGRFEEAGEQWKQLLRLDAENPYAHAGLVRTHEQLSANAVEQLTGRNPESPYLLRLLGHARLMAQQYPSALFLFREALKRDPGVRLVHEAIAKIYERTGHSEWAQIENRIAASLPAPDCRSSRSAECAFVAGQFEKVPSVSAASSPEQIFWAARAHAAMAADAYAALSGLPETVDRLNLVADILASQQQYSKAADACRSALEIRPGDPALERQLAELLYFARRIDEARPMLQRFQREDPQDPRWPAMLGSLLAGEQQYESAVPMLEAALALPGHPPSVHVDLGRVYLALGDPKEALEHLQAASGTDLDGSIHYQLSQAYQRLGMRDRAREALAQYRELQSGRREQIEASASLEITPPN